MARCCLALWSSEQVDRHLLPFVALGVTVGYRLLPPWGESPLHVLVSQGCWWPAVSGLGGCISLALPQPTVGSQEVPVSWGQPLPTLRQRTEAVWVCVPVCVCRVSVPFSAVS